MESGDGVEKMSIIGGSVGKESGACMGGGSGGDVCKKSWLVLGRGRGIAWATGIAAA